MDQFTEELVEAGVFVAAAGLKWGTDAKRVIFDGRDRLITDGPFAESRELIADRAPNLGPGEMEIRPFFEVADLGAYGTPEELAAPRTGERGKLGVA